MTDDSKQTTDTPDHVRGFLGILGGAIITPLALDRYGHLLPDWAVLSLVVTLVALYAIYMLTRTGLHGLSTSFHKHPILHVIGIVLCTGLIAGTAVYLLMRTPRRTETSTTTDSHTQKSGSQTTTTPPPVVSPPVNKNHIAKTPNSGAKPTVQPQVRSMPLPVPDGNTPVLTPYDELKAAYDKLSSFNNEYSQNVEKVGQDFTGPYKMNAPGPMPAKLPNDLVQRLIVIDGDATYYYRDHLEAMIRTAHDRAVNDAVDQKKWTHHQKDMDAQKFKDADIQALTQATFIEIQNDRPNKAQFYGMENYLHDLLNELGTVE